MNPNIGAGGGNNTCNLFSDGGFEAGAGNWVSNTTPTVVGGARTGAGALNFNNGFLGQTFDVTPGTQYTFSGFYQSDGNSGWAGFGVDFVDANGNEVGELVRTLEVAADWNAFTLDASIPAGAVFIRPWFFTQPGRTVTLDDIDLRPSGCVNGQTGNQPPFVANPGNQVGAVGDTVNLPISAIDPEGSAVTFSATNLPAGLTIGPNNGMISGTLQADGASNVTVSASDGDNSGQSTFSWTVTDPNGGGNCNALTNGSFESGMVGWTSSVIGEEVRTLNESSAYAPFVLSFTSPANTVSIRVWVYTDSDREVTLDAVDLREVGCSGNNGNNGGSACNAVQNPGFEINSGGWFTNTTPTLVPDAGQGNQAVQISDGWISHAMPAVAGQSYTGTALVKSAGNSGWSGMGLDFVDANGTKLADAVQTIDAVSSYGSLSVSGTAPAGTDQVLVWFFADANRTTNVDDVDVRLTNCTD